MSPRANRYMQDGYVYHLTVRCHNRSFLFKYARWRDEYRRRLRVLVRNSSVALLGECVTSNHVHLLVSADRKGDVSSLMQRLQGDFAQCYNIAKHRSGSFWEGPYHATLVQSGFHLWSCLLYIDLNMVRAGKVSHPSEWPQCSYREHIGARQRYRLLDTARMIELTESGGEEEFRREYSDALDELLDTADMRREPHWTESVAVGDREFVLGVADRLSGRIKLTVSEHDTGICILKDSEQPIYEGVQLRAVGPYDGAMLIR